MKKHNKFYIIQTPFSIVLICSIMLLSCNNLFDELATNPNQQDVNGFYSSPENINRGVIGIYSYLTNARSFGAPGVGLLSHRGDESSDRSLYGIPGQNQPNGTAPFQMVYTAASQACQMIESIPSVEFANKELKNTYLGEAYFLRGFSHFYLFMLFRNIPLMDKVPKSSADYYRPQAKPEDVWELIIDDLKKAKELLPTKEYWEPKYKGRVTSAAATALLGKAYLYRSGIEKYFGASTATYYNEAAACFDEIIKGKHGNYVLVDNYNDNFRVETENNDESIFELQFLGDAINTGFNPGLTNSGAWRDPRGYYPPSPYSNGDHVIHDWVYEIFISSKDINGKTDSRMFGTLIFNDQDPAINPKANDEVRIFDNKTFTEFYGPTGFASVSSGAGKYKAACRKGIDWTLPTQNPGNNMHIWNTRANGLNYIYIRYADVLLMYAEAVVSGGKQGSITPKQAVNMVRARKSVNLPPLTNIDMSAIERERILELTLEGHRFFDLLRWGKVSKRFKELEMSDPNFKQYNTQTYSGWVENKYEWLPLPVDEVEGNPYITENNPGWN